MISYDILPTVVKQAIDTLSLDLQPLYINEGDVQKAVVLSPLVYENLCSSVSTQKNDTPMAALEEAYINFLLIVSTAMDSHEAYLAGHTDRVTMLACALSDEMNVDTKYINDLRLAALLHDIGEVAIPADILNKAGKLTTEEIKLLRQHPLIGSEIVATISKLKRVAEIIRAHHEKYDGGGYPKGLKGEEIPLGARILAVVDAYDAMTNLRTNRENIDHNQAIDELRRFSGSSFDPHVVELFEKIF